jgi:hypothetical protein
MTGKLEKELVKATGFKPPKGGYKDRQDELAALARLGSKLPDDDFDDLSDEAGNWVNAAVKAIMAKGTIKDFTDDTGAASAEDDEDVHSAEAGDDAEEQEPKDGDDGGAGDPDDGLREADAQAEADAEADNEADEADQEVIKPHKRRKHDTKRPKVDPAKIKRQEVRLARGKALEGMATRYDHLDGSIDRYGVLIGTKTHDAVLLYEKGTTSKELLEKAGGRFYNILRRLTENGHLVERSPEGVFTLTHKDEIRALMEKRKAAKATGEKKGKKK